MDFFDKSNENELLSIVGVNIFDTNNFSDETLEKLFGFVCDDETAEEEEEAWDIFPSFLEV